MQNVLIKISGGIIDKVEFYSRASDAVRALSAYVKTMYPERDEAAVFGNQWLHCKCQGFP